MERGARQILQSGPGKNLYRGMREASDGRPVCGSSARMLGARRHIDIPVDRSGIVHPGTGGMSVVPDAPKHLPRHRRPPAYGGTGNDPVWRMQETTLGPQLRYIPDDAPMPIHGVIAPAVMMTFEAYEQAIEETAPHWTRNDP